MSKPGTALLYQIRLDRERLAKLEAINADLLEALREARSQLEAYELERSGEAYNSLQINAAIALATGASQ